MIVRRSFYYDVVYLNYLIFILSLDAPISSDLSSCELVELSTARINYLFLLIFIIFVFN